MTDLEDRARAYATRKHAGQLRKYTGEPYIQHPLAVAEIVRGVPHTPEMIAAAVLHDVIEDTDATLNEVELEFGREVARFVYFLSDISQLTDGNREVRKAIDRAHIALAPAQAKTVKLADLIDNSRSIAAHDPNFARVYLKEKARLLEVLREGDQQLWILANDLVVQFSRELEASK